MKNGNSCFKIRRIYIRRQSPFKSRFKSFFESFHFFRVFIACYYNLLVCIVKSVKCVEKFFFCLNFSGNKLNIVYHKYVHRAVFVSELVHFFFSDGADKLIRERFGRNICNFGIRLCVEYVISYCMEKMRFSETYAAVKEKRIICKRGRFGNRKCRSMCKSVGISDNKSVKSVFRVQRHSRNGSFFKRFRSFLLLVFNGYFYIVFFAAYLRNTVFYKIAVSCINNISLNGGGRYYVK